MSEDETDLAAARRAGSTGREAFGRLFDRHATVVLAVCRRHVPLRDAEDALQETFIRAHRMLERVEDASRLRSWLFGIASRVCSEKRRSEGRRRKHEEGAAMNTKQRRESATDNGALSAASNAEALDRLSQAMDELPERERLAIHLYYLEREPARAAEEHLGLSRSGFYKLLARAREQLAELMGERITT